ncbi:MAG: hypothetical protein MUC38_12105 [Cyclobacteriaceae bacterium]|jgi:hypothetical protein|nr:hypothetical protein [Cyclobacteriaceae bacterium]
MFRQTFLRWRTESALTKNKNRRASIPYRHAQAVGIIFSVEDKAKHEEIKHFVKQLEQDGKRVSVLEFLPRKKENYEFLFDFFTLQDLSFWGNLESQSAQKFASLPFDYLYYVDHEHNPLILHLLAKSQAHCRIGSHQPESTAFFELMIEQKGSLKGLIENMLKYTQNLR